MVSRFDDIRLPVNIERGALYTARTNTLVTRLANGRSVANQQWPVTLGRWDITYGLQELDPVVISEGIRAVSLFHQARHGQARTFRFKDWLDFKLNQEPIGFLDGVAETWQMKKKYADFGGFSETKDVILPSQDTAFVVRYDGIVKTEGVDFSINYATGLITSLTGAPAGTGVEVVDVTGDFEKLVSFEEPTLDIRQEWLQSAEVRSVPIIEELYNA